MNPLVVDKISKKFLWEKDSGFLYTKQLIASLPKNWRFTVLTPKGFDRNFFDQEHIIECAEYDYSTSIHQNRYHFNRNILAKLFPYGTDVDLVINHQPEVTANLRVFFENQRRDKPLIINYFHWIDCKESAKFAEELGGFIWRQIEGINNADLSLFHTWYAIELIEQSRQEHGLQWSNRVPALSYFTPIGTKFGQKPIDLPDKKIILFNHRLNNTTGWREVIKILDDVYSERDDFVLWITDDQNLKEKKNLEKYPWVVVQRVPFESYGYLIKNSHFAICNTKGYATWNMAVLDCLQNGCTPIPPHNKLYSSMLGANFIQHGSTSKWGELPAMVRGLLDTPKQLIDDWIQQAEVKQDQNIAQWAEDMIRDRVKDKIKNYDQVANYIERNNPCEKRKWVNEFWTFHVNSNFQLIRWKLLVDGGFTDDVTSKLTLYSK